MERKRLTDVRINIEINKTLGDWEETLRFTVLKIEELERAGYKDRPLFEHLTKTREKAIAEIARLIKRGKKIDKNSP